MTTNTKQKPVHMPGVAARNIQAIWSHKDSANSSRPVVVQSMSNKDHYCADRATD